MRLLKTIKLAAVSSLVLTGCAGYGRPEMTSVSDSMMQIASNPQVHTSNINAVPSVSKPGSLWQAGSKQFFRDSRASEVGDIVTVVVAESSQAESTANTETTREHISDSALNSLLGLTDKLVDRGINPASLVSSDSNREYTGEATTDREDFVNARIAAVVTQTLPNGYLVIQGSRELMINYELQDLQIQGIIRPEDISADNTIPSEKIAQARITYAGRGLVDESQQPQSGQRFLDKWLPF